MPRSAIPPISSAGQQVLAAYTQYVQEHQDLAAASRRNYLSDVRQFMAWQRVVGSSLREDTYAKSRRTTITEHQTKRSCRLIPPHFSVR